MQVDTVQGTPAQTLCSTESTFKEPVTGSFPGGTVL